MLSNSGVAVKPKIACLNTRGRREGFFVVIPRNSRPARRFFSYTAKMVSKWAYLMNWRWLRQTLPKHTLWKPVSSLLFFLASLSSSLVVHKHSWISSTKTRSYSKYSSGIPFLFPSNDFWRIALMYSWYKYVKRAASFLLFWLFGLLAPPYGSWLEAIYWGNKIEGGV